MLIIIIIIIIDELRERAEREEGCSGVGWPREQTSRRADEQEQGQTSHPSLVQCLCAI